MRRRQIGIEHRQISQLIQRGYSLKVYRVLVLYPCSPGFSRLWSDVVDDDAPGDDKEGQAQEGLEDRKGIGEGLVACPFVYLASLNTTLGSP